MVGNPGAEADRSLVDNPRAKDTTIECSFHQVRATTEHIGKLSLAELLPSTIQARRGNGGIAERVITAHRRLRPRQAEQERDAASQLSAARSFVAAD